jgi:hypothetical protein
MNEIFRSRDCGHIPSDSVAIVSTDLDEFFVLFSANSTRSGVWLKTFVEYSKGGPDHPDAELFQVAESFTAFWTLLKQSPF